MNEQRFEIGRGAAQKVFLILGAIAVFAGGAMIVSRQFGIGALMLVGGAFMIVLATWMPGTLIISDEALSIERKRGSQRFAWSEISKVTWSSSPGAVTALASDNWVLTITGPAEKLIVLSGPMVGKQHAEVKAALTKRLNS